MDLNFENIPGVIEVIDREYPTLICDPGVFESTCFFIKSNINGIWLIDIFALDLSVEGKGLELRYVFNIVEINKTFILCLKISKEDQVKSISHFFKNASTFEQEIFEFFGIHFDRFYENKIFHKENQIRPLLKDELRRPLAKELPSNDHLFVIENYLKKQQLKFELTTEDNRVENCSALSGFYHQGIEKVLEGQGVGLAYQTLELAFPTSLVEWSFLLTFVCEKNLGVIVPDRAKALRMVLLEFSRIFNHLIFLRDLNIYFKHDRLYQQSLLWLKRLQSLFISFSGNEYLRNVIRLGGVIRDVNQPWLSRAMDEIILLEKDLLRYYKFTLSNETWRESLNINLVHKSDSADSSLSGPIVRSAGLNIDYRKISPFYFYSDVDFEIPVATSGTAFDLYCVKVEEIFQSFKIILQVLDNLPTGRCVHEDYLDLSQIKNSLSAYNEHDLRNKVDKLFSVGSEISSLGFIEGANGLMCLNLFVSNSKIYRSRLFSNDLNLKTVFENIIRKKDLSEIELIWNVLNPNLKHIER